MSNLQPTRSLLPPQQGESLVQVIGLGKSGLAAARLLRQQGWRVALIDSNDNASLRQQQQQLALEGIAVDLGQKFALGELSPEQRQTLGLVVVSPGVPWDLPGLVDARHQGVDMVGEMGLAWRALGQYPWVCITGTNGKTTTTALIAAIFQRAGKQAPACGNIGYAACELAFQVTTQQLTPPLDWVIAEVSSYQIESGDGIAPAIGLWTTFTPDHLSRHKTLDNYYAIKARLLRDAQQPILNGDDPYLRQTAVEEFPQAIWTSVQGKSALPANPERGVYLENGWVMAGGDRLVEAATLRMVGAHNQQNLLMAVAAAQLAGIDPGAIAAAVAEFPGVAHRLELICSWQGIDFINDSKATNYDAAEVGLRAVAAPTVLIAGGEAKAGDDQAWIARIQAQAIAVVLIGTAAPQFAERLSSVGYTAWEIADTLDQAVPRAAAIASHHSGPSVVLLSPACASFDQYANFEQRGDDFRRICLAYTSI